MKKISKDGVEYKTRDIASSYKKKELMDILEDK